MAEFTPLGGGLGARLGGSIGGALSQDIGQALDYLTQSKIQQRLQQLAATQLAPGFQALNPQLTQEQAIAIAKFAPQVQKEYLRQIIPGLQAAPAEAALEDILSGQTVPTGVKALKQEPKLQPPSSLQLTPGLQALSSYKPEFVSQQEFEKLPSEQKADVAIDSMMSPSKKAQEDTVGFELSPGALAKKEIQRMEEYLQRSTLTPKQKQQVREQLDKRHKVYNEEQKEIDKDTNPLVKEILANSRASIENNRKLSRIEKLNEEGNLGSPLGNALINKISEGIFGIGLDLNSFLTADAAELDKLATDFVKDAKPIFGSRLTDQDLKTFLKTIPTLMQSKEGRRKIIRNLRIANDSAIARRKAYEETLRENFNRRPRELELIIDQKLDPILEKLSSEFISAPIGPEEERGFLSRLGTSLGIIY